MESRTYFQNTRVIMNTYCSQMDPEMWGDPENFQTRAIFQFWEQHCEWA